MKNARKLLLYKGPTKGCEKCCCRCCKEQKEKHCSSSERLKRSTPCYPEISKLFALLPTQRSFIAEGKKRIISRMGYLPVVGFTTFGYLLCVICFSFLFCHQLSRILCRYLFIDNYFLNNRMQINLEKMHSLLIILHLTVRTYCVKLPIRTVV